MSGQLELVDVHGRTLTELADIANREHDLAFAAAGYAVIHALNCGAALNEARGRFRYGEWLPWLKANFTGSQPTAWRFMKIAASYSDLNDLPASQAAALRALGAGGDLDPLMSSASAEWSTPDELFKVLDDEFGFTLDVCATAENAKCARYFTADDDGLAQHWTGVCWMNPPYGSAIKDWMAKAHDAARAGVTVVCLVPARTDTEWWWEHARHGEVRFLRGRLRFGDAATAPFPSAVVVLGRRARVRWWEP
jgi:phage N-6-adenine-methyltransferase